MSGFPTSPATSVRPVTIRQLLDATRPHSAASFSIDDILADHVSTVAHVVDVRITNACVIYELEDGTSLGRIAARQWHSDMVEQLPNDDQQLYIYVVGQLDTKAPMNSRNVLNVRRIHRITNIADRLFFHLMETTFVTLCYKRGTPPASSLPLQSPPMTPTPASQPRNYQTPSDTSPTPPSSRSQSPPRSPQILPQRHSQTSPTRRITQTTPLRSIVLTTPVRQLVPSRPNQQPQSSPKPLGQRSSMATSPEPSRAVAIPSVPPRASAGSRRQSGIKPDPYAHLTVLQRAILLQILNSRSSQDGASVTAIVRGVSHHSATTEQIGDALYFLKEEGFVENTVDVSHYVLKTSHYPRSP